MSKDGGLRMVFADPDGRVYDHPHLLAGGASGGWVLRPPTEDFIPLPPGSRLFNLPQCQPLGWSSRGKRLSLLESTHIDKRSFPTQAVAAFLPPGYVRTLLPAVDYSAKNYVLPLWPYAAVAWQEDGFRAAAYKIDEKPHWLPENFDDRELVPQVKKRLRAQPKNRLLKHLAHCATNYHCFAAKNLFLKRGECPLPTSPSCNARCLGCLSEQPPESCPASHERIKFIPTVDEIVGVALPHLEEVEDAIVSFGQGCEGEPLLAADTLTAAVAELRRQTQRGAIHLNTNASRPEAIARMADAGLNSIRVSMNSSRSEMYQRYFNPPSYSFADVLRSLKIAGEKKLFISINLFIFPGLSDQEEEIASLKELIASYHVNLIQMRNLCIDPQIYCERMSLLPRGGIGIRNMMNELACEFPQLQFGYFNRSPFSFSPPSELK